MPRGVPLTPEQIAAATEAFRKTGSYADAGRAIGVEVSVARRALLRHRESERDTLHARAIRKAQRRARRHINDALDEIAERLATTPNDSAAAQLASALVRLSDSILAIEERGERRAQARMNRRKTRAEIEVLQKKAAGELAPDTVVLNAGDEAFDRLMRDKFGHAPVRYDHRQPTGVQDAEAVQPVSGGEKPR